MDIKDRILQERKLKGVSQEDLAFKIGVSRQTISKWEAGQSFPDIEKIEAMCEVFDVSADYLIRGIDEKRAIRIDPKIIVIIVTILNIIAIMAYIGINAYFGAVASWTLSMCIFFSRPCHLLYRHVLCR